MLSSAKIVAFAPSKDLRRSRKFYEGILGLRFVSEDQFAAVFDAAGTMLRVAAVPDFQPAPFTILGWRVPKIDAIVRKLQAEKIPFERYNFLQQDDLGVWISPSGARVAWFKDPDGNLLSLTQFPGRALKPNRKKQAALKSRKPRRTVRR